MKRGTSPIREVVKSVFTHLEHEQRFSKEEIENTWKKLVGGSGFGHSRPVALKKKVLTVCVDNSSWMQELTIRKRELLKGLKRALGKDRVSEIHFKIGEY